LPVTVAKFICCHGINNVCLTKFHSKILFSKFTFLYASCHLTKLASCGFHEQRCCY
jgi:hypothetical protein